MDTNKATLDHCKNSGCGWACCNYGKDGHIIMLPEEFEKADGSTSHLEIIDDDYNGGKKVKCKAANTANCDNGYKPIQCGVYPLWVKAEDDIVRSQKCPLANAVVELHKPEAVSIIQEYKEQHPEVKIEEFLTKAEVDRYEEF